MQFGMPKQRIDRALTICSGPSAGPVVRAGLPELPGVSTIAVNMSILELPHADWWVSGCYETARHYGKVKAANHALFLKPEKFEKCKAGNFPFPNLPDDTHVISRCLETKGFVFDGERLCRYDTGFATVNFAAALGAKRIALLGYDCTYREWFHKHVVQSPTDPPQGTRRSSTGLWETTAKQLAERGIEIRNGSPDSACKEWNRRTPQEALEWISAK